LEVLGLEQRVSYVPSGSVFARLRQKQRSVAGPSLLALGDPAFAAPTARRPAPPKQGVMLTAVQPGGSAHRAGLRGGDVLVQMGGTPLKSVDDLQLALSAGGRVRYWHEGQEKSVQLPVGALGVRVDSRPAAQAVAAWRQAREPRLPRGPVPVPLPGTRWEVEALGRLAPGTTRLLGADASVQRLGWNADDRATALLMVRFYENLLGKRAGLTQPLPRAEALEEARQWLRGLRRRDAEQLVGALRRGKLGGTQVRGSIVEFTPKEGPPRLPAGERPYAHPFYWATFVLVGDPD
jgi:hypothetical protein